jgi:FkbM family methyltransferase
MHPLALRAIAKARRSIGFPMDRIEALMRRFGAAHPDAFFIEIGANDGFARDPLRLEIKRRRWRGIMVEPVPYVFEWLRERYGSHPRIALEQAAIAERDGVLPFYHLREATPGEQVWGWYHALGSFNRDVVLSNRDLVPDIEDRLVETKVPAMTFAQLCEKHDVDDVDLVLIDTEGYDYEILKSMDLAARRPRLVVYEHLHLSSEDRAAARGMLEAEGYITFEDDLDTAALDTTRLSPKDRRLHRFVARTRDRPTPVEAA